MTSDCFTVLGLFFYLFDHFVVSKNDTKQLVVILPEDNMFEFLDKYFLSESVLIKAELTSGDLKFAETRVGSCLMRPSNICPNFYCFVFF